MAFGDNGKRKKTFFEKLTMVVIVIMLIVTVGAIFAAVHYPTKGLPSNTWL